MVLFLAEISSRSLRKLFIIIINKKYLWIKVSKNKICNFENRSIALNIEWFHRHSVQIYQCCSLRSMPPPLKLALEWNKTNSMWAFWSRYWQWMTHRFSSVDKWHQSSEFRKGGWLVGLTRLRHRTNNRPQPNYGMPSTNLHLQSTLDSIQLALWSMASIHVVVLALRSVNLPRILIILIICNIFSGSKYQKKKCMIIWKQKHCMSQPLVLFKPKYWFGHPENYLFSLSTNFFTASSVQEMVF